MKKGDIFHVKDHVNEGRVTEVVIDVFDDMAEEVHFHFVESGRKSVCSDAAFARTYVAAPS